MDRTLLVILLLLSLTVISFVSGIIPYPFGVLVLLAFLVLRLWQLKDEIRTQHKQR